MGGDDRVTVGCKVSSDKRQKLRVIASVQGVTPSELLRESIDSIIEDSEIPEEKLEDLLQNTD